MLPNFLGIFLLSIQIFITITKTIIDLGVLHSTYLSKFVSEQKNISKTLDGNYSWLRTTSKNVNRKCVISKGKGILISKVYAVLKERPFSSIMLDKDKVSRKWGQWSFEISCRSNLKSQWIADEEAEKIRRLNLLKYNKIYH